MAPDNSEPTSISEANLKAHNQMHDDDPALFRFQADAQMANTVAAARSLGIHHDLIKREGSARASDTNPLARYLKDHDRPLGRVSTEGGQSLRKDKNSR